MEPYQLIRQRRETLGLSLAFVAAQSGMETMEYYHVESNDYFSDPSIGQLRLVCETLSLDFRKLFLVESERFCTPRIQRNKLIHARRLELHFTQNELSDRIGFEQWVIEDMERDPNFLERWPLELISDLAKQLELPMGLLL